MTKNEPITEVMFRKFQGEIIALFPYDLYDTMGMVSCYAHVGQHSGADYHYVISHSTPVLESEYIELYKELVSIGYSLKIIKKRNISRFLGMLRGEQNKVNKL